MAGNPCLPDPSCAGDALYANGINMAATTSTCVGNQQEPSMRPGAGTSVGSLNISARIVAGDCGALKPRKCLPAGPRFLKVCVIASKTRSSPTAQNRLELELEANERERAKAPGSGSPPGDTHPFRTAICQRIADTNSWQQWATGLHRPTHHREAPGASFKTKEKGNTFQKLAPLFLAPAQGSAPLAMLGTNESFGSHRRQAYTSGSSANAKSFSAPPAASGGRAGAAENLERQGNSRHSFLKVRNSHLFFLPLHKEVLHWQCWVQTELRKPPPPGIHIWLISKCQKFLCSHPVQILASVRPLAGRKQ